MGVKRLTDREHSNPDPTHEQLEYELADRGLTRRQVIKGGAALATGIGLASYFSASRGVAAISTGIGATTIPSVKLRHAVAPYENECLWWIGKTNGYYSDVGIDVSIVKQDLSAGLAPLLTGNVDIGGTTTATQAAQIENVKDVVVWLSDDIYVGGGLWAPKGTKARSLKEFMASGLDFNDAITRTLQQFRGKRVAISTDPASKNRHQIIFAMGGLKFSDVKLVELDEPGLVAAALGHKADLIGPSSPSTLIRLQEDGGKELVNVRQILDFSHDSSRIALASYACQITTRHYFDDNYATLLRVSSVYYRVIDFMRSQFPDAVKSYLPFYNSYTGQPISSSDVKFIFGKIDFEQSFEQMNNYVNAKGTGLNLYGANQVILDGLTHNGVLKKHHDPQEFIVARKVYNDLKRYKSKSEILFDRIGSGAKHADVVARARKQFNARNYLDSYRFLSSIKS
jgi:ABC-type nitrate/sulfonate/bicarbonate transport system substrate-binding protein